MFLLSICILFSGKFLLVPGVSELPSGEATTADPKIVPDAIFTRNQTVQFQTVHYNSSNKTSSRKIGWLKILQKHIESNNFSSSSMIVLVPRDVSHLNAGVLLNQTTILSRGKYDRQSTIYSLRYTVGVNGPLNISSFKYDAEGNYTILHVKERIPPPAIPAKIIKGMNLISTCRIFRFAEFFALQRLRLFIRNDSVCSQVFPSIEMSNKFCGEMETFTKKYPENIRLLQWCLSGQRQRFEEEIIQLEVEDNYPVFCRQEGEYRFSGFAKYQKMWKGKPFMLIQRKKFT